MRTRNEEHLTSHGPTIPSKEKVCVTTMNQGPEVKSATQACALVASRFSFSRLSHAISQWREGGSSSSEWPIRAYILDIESRESNDDGRRKLNGRRIPSDESGLGYLCPSRILSANNSRAAHAEELLSFRRREFACFPRHMPAAMNNCPISCKCSPVLSQVRKESDSI